MNYGRVQMSNPPGWYQLCFSHELLPGVANPHPSPASEIVAWRAGADTIAALERNCPHLGAQLGPRLQENDVVCPMHNWQFTARGTCSNPPDATAQAIAYDTSERYGGVFVWLPSGAAERELPRFDALDTVASRIAWTCHDEWVLATGWWDIGENGVDASHLAALHGMPAASDYELIDETLHSRHVRLKQAIRLGAEGEFVNTINTMNYGAGLGFTHFSGSIEVFVVSGAMPVKNGSTKLRCTYYVPEQEFPRLIQMSRLFVLALRRGMREDHSIWQHKRDCQRPLLAPGERAIAEWRAWARRISMTGVAGGEDGH